LGIVPRISIPSHRRILGLDPALRTLGFARLVQTESTLVPVELGLIRTDEIDDLSASQSNFVAGQDLYAEVRDLIIDERGIPKVDEIRAEAMSYPPGAASSGKISVCWGVIASVTREFGIPVKQASPQTIRKALGLPKRSASEKQAGKDDVLRAMEAKFGAQTIADLLARAGLTTKADKRHPVDALAATVAIR
jgi:Holliday junction resolvasome RuvABC endonuclease subunit